MDFSAENPFADLMNKAVKLKGHQQAQLRPVFDSWPQYFQHSMFMQESVVSQRSKPFEERIAAAESMKAQGNERFSRNDLEEAVAEYEKALAVFKYCENRDPGWKKKGIEDSDIIVVDFKCEDSKDQKRLDALKISCYLNIAVSKFKLKEYNTCIRACDDALLIDSQQLKAYYRRALALITPKSSGALEFEQAIVDLEKAYAIDPANRDVRKLLRELKEQKVRQRKLDRETFSGMFERGEIYTKEKDEITQRLFSDSSLCYDSEERFQKEVDEAEHLAILCESKGHDEYAKEIRDKIEQAKLGRQRRLKQIDFFNPSPEMIEDAKQNGIDLTDPSVQQMLHELQEQERNNGNKRSTTAGSEVESVDSILKTMTRSEITTMLTREGIDCHKISDREQLMATAREVLLSKVSKAQGPSEEKPSYFYSIFMIACVWTLLRLYSTGGLTTVGRLLQTLMTGSHSDTSVIQDADDIFED